jgi:hypothetical protein
MLLDSLGNSSSYNSFKNLAKRIKQRDKSVRLRQAVLPRSSVS